MEKSLYLPTVPTTKKIAAFRKATTFFSTYANPGREGILPIKVTGNANPAFLLHKLATNILPYVIIGVKILLFFARGLNDFLENFRRIYKSVAG
jgi:hypothetical protein